MRAWDLLLHIYTRRVDRSYLRLGVRVKYFILADDAGARHRYFNVALILRARLMRYSYTMMTMIGCWKPEAHFL